MARHDDTLREDRSAGADQGEGSRPREAKVVSVAAIRGNVWLRSIALCALPLLAGWLVVSTVYLFWHDPLLHAVMTRQIRMQDAYEDRIAALTSELDRTTNQGAVERQALGETLANLAALGTRLERRSEMLAALVNRTDGAPRPASVPALGLEASPRQARLSPASIPASRPALRLGDDDAGAADLSTGVETRPTIDEGARRAALLSAVFARIERRQVRSVIGLRGPVLARNARLRDALTLSGVPLPPADGVGGPFVPLAGTTSETGAPDVMAFETMAADLHDAISRGEALSKVVEAVPLRRPLSGPLEVTSTFGPRPDPFLGRPAMHTGIDLLDGSDDRVLSTAAGVVTIAGPDGGYGNLVEIDHGHGLATRYAHLASIDVAVHQKVAAGTLIGHVGATGRATGPHLHYETRVNGVPVDPARFLKAGFGLSPGD